MKSTYKHNFSKVYTKNDRYLLVGCTDCQRIQGGLILMNRPKFQHNFSKVYTKNDRYLLVGCVDCEKTITFFLKRFD